MLPKSPRKIHKPWTGGVALRLISRVARYFAIVMVIVYIFLSRERHELIVNDLLIQRNPAVSKGEYYVERQQDTHLLPEANVLREPRLTDSLTRGSLSTAPSLSDDLRGVESSASTGKSETSKTDGIQNGLPNELYVDASSSEADKETDGVLFGLNSYRPLFHPVLDSITQVVMENPVMANPVQVRFLTGPHTSPTSQSISLVDGIERSTYTKLVSISFLEKAPHDITVIRTNADEPDQLHVWMVDFVSIDRDCHALYTLVQHTIEKIDVTERMILLVVDYSGSSEVAHCPRIEKFIPREQIRFALRNAVMNRHWDPRQNWIHPGEIAPNEGNLVSGGPTLHVPFVVRDVFAAAVKIMASSERKLKLRNKVKNPADTKRSNDIAYFWRHGDNSHYSFLRRDVGFVIANLEGEYAGKRKIRTFIKVIGDNTIVDTNGIAKEYVKQLLSAKIVVLAQRDEWENHYRLFESLASGALVFADAMLVLPEGLEHTKNIVLYDSAQSLKDSLLYYLDPKNDSKRLSIAREGWALAMGQHQSWHRVESLLFGKPLSHVDVPYDPAPAKRKREVLSEDDLNEAFEERW